MMEDRHMRSGASGRNGLHLLCAAGSVLVGTFLVLGAWGHLEAVLPIEGDRWLSLWVPAVILAGSGLVNLALCKALWDGSRLALSVALVTTAVALVYLSFLLAKGVPGHPVALFTGIVACYGVLLLATRLGLVWSLES